MIAKINMKMYVKTTCFAAYFKEIPGKVVVLVGWVHLAAPVPTVWLMSSEGAVTPTDMTMT